MGDTSNARVKVIVRVRPLRGEEARNKEVQEIVKAPSNAENDQSLSIYDPASLLAGVRTELVQSWSRDFTFDKCLWSNDPSSYRYARQETLFEEVGHPVLEWIFDGFNCCVFAFGQTGSGKTYSMMGDLNGGAEHYGLTPRICFSIFDRVEQLQQARGTLGSGPSEVSVTFSHMEIYNESVIDLLAPPVPPGTRPKTLRIREHPKHGIFVQNLTRVKVTSFEEVLGMIVIGDKNRTVAATQANQHSSRSHAIVTLTIVQRARQEVMTTNGLPTTGVQKMEGRVHLVDLAGSERVAVSGAQKVRLKEACSINKSLSVLADVILSLSSGKKKHVPYRNSAITMVLKDSLGGNAHAIMVATVSPSNFDYEESISTLKYADRAKKVRMRVDANISSGLQATDTSAVEMVPLLQAEVQKLKEMLAQQQQASEYIDRVAQLERQLEEREELIHSLSQPHLQPHQVAIKDALSPTSSVPLQPQHMQQIHQHQQQMQTQQPPMYREASEDSSTDDFDLLSTFAAASAVSGGRVRTMSGATPTKQRNASSRPQQAVLAEDAKDVTTPRLINLNQDPLFTECLVFYLPADAQIIAGSRPDCYVPLSAHDVLPEHCVIRLDRELQEVVVTPFSGALVFVNGVIVTRPQPLSTFDRISLGRFHLFRFERQDMRTGAGRAGGEGGIDPTLSALAPGWEFAQQELLVKNNYFQSLPAPVESASAFKAHSPPHHDHHHVLASASARSGGVGDTRGPGGGGGSAFSTVVSKPTELQASPPLADGVPKLSSPVETGSTSGAMTDSGATSTLPVRRSTVAAGGSSGFGFGNGANRSPMRYVPVLDSPHLSLRLPQSSEEEEEAVPGLEAIDRTDSMSGMSSGVSGQRPTRRHTINRFKPRDVPTPMALPESTAKDSNSSNNPVGGAFGLDNELRSLEGMLDSELEYGTNPSSMQDGPRSRSPIVNLTNSPRSPGDKKKRAGSLSSYHADRLKTSSGTAGTVGTTQQQQTTQYDSASAPSSGEESVLWNRISAVADGAERADPHELRHMLKMVIDRAEGRDTQERPSHHSGNVFSHTEANASASVASAPPLPPAAMTTPATEDVAITSPARKGSSNAGMKIVMPPSQSPARPRRFVSRLADGGNSNSANALVRQSSDAVLSPRNAAGKGAFEAEAQKLKDDLQNMQNALNERMNRYNSTPR
jgi:hypothetical protein